MLIWQYKVRFGVVSFHCSRTLFFYGYLHWKRALATLQPVKCFTGDQFPIHPPGGGGMLKRHDLRKQALAGFNLHAPGMPTLQRAMGEDEDALVKEETDGEPSELPQMKPNSMPEPNHRHTPAAVSWEKYWDERVEVKLTDRGATLNVYSTGPKDAAVVLCLHGAGYTGLTWSLVASRLKEKGYRVVAPDLRGHGLTTTQDDSDFSKETMSADVVSLWHHMFGNKEKLSAGDEPDQAPVSAQLAAASGAGEPATPVGNPKPVICPAPALQGTPTVIVGHSMGGGIAVWAATGGRIPGLAGLVVVDVVEGTAIAALPHMMGVIAARPTSFSSPTAAVAWALRGGMCRCKDAAAVSMPSQLRRQMVPSSCGDVGAVAAAPNTSSHTEAGHRAHAPVSAQGGSARSSSDGEGGSEAGGPWVWRTPLVATRPYWEGWYTGLSDAFLQVPGPKMLVLAGTDRLDRSLTIGQMQGKFQLVLLPTAGHAIQEDESRATAEHFENFLKRFRVGQPPMVIPRAPPGITRVLPVVAGPTL